MGMMKNIYSDVTEMYFDGVTKAEIAVRMELPLYLVTQIVEDIESFEQEGEQLEFDL